MEGDLRPAYEIILELVQEALEDIQWTIDRQQFD